MKRGIIRDRDQNENYFEFLMKAFIKVSIVNPISWLLNNLQKAVLALADINEFSKFTSNLLKLKFAFMNGLTLFLLKMENYLQTGEYLTVHFLKRCQLQTGHKNGYQVILNNVCLMHKWLFELKKKLDKYAAEENHENFYFSL